MVGLVCALLLNWEEVVPSRYNPLLNFKHFVDVLQCEETSTLLGRHEFHG
jgi:hypothetical protein